MKMITVFILFVVLILSPQSASAVEIYLLYTNNTNGALENCLCPGKSYGSLEKRIFYFRQWLVEHPNTILVDAGDFLSSTHNSLKDSIAFRGYEMMPYDAVALGDQEFFRGIPFLKALMNSSSLPFVASNLVEPEFPNLKTEIVVVRQGIMLGIFSVLDPAIFKFYPKSVSSALDFSNFEEIIGQQVTALKERVDIIVLLSHLGIEKDRELAASVDGIDIIVGSHTQSVLLEPESVNNTIIVQAGKDGYYVGELKLTFDEEKVLQSFHGRLVPMDITLPNDPKMVEMIIDYNRLKRQSLTRRVQRIVSIPAEFLVASPELCGNCHPDQWQHWLTTAHAASFETLESEHKYKAPDCLACHTSGFGRDDGYLNYNITASLKTVNCTECHYVPADHLLESGPHELDTIEEETCLRCHDQTNSPSFEFASFTERIRHPLFTKKIIPEVVAAEIPPMETPHHTQETDHEPTVEKERISTRAASISEGTQDESNITEISVVPEGDSAAGKKGDEISTQPVVMSYLTHIVVEGESLWKLAEFYLGAGKLWLNIYELNEKKIADPDLIREGQVLIIPLLQEEQ
ncbi:MAG: multiheme c-type cytochrome [Fidelibacterota bacterium]